MLGPEAALQICANLIRVPRAVLAAHTLQRIRAYFVIGERFVAELWTFKAQVDDVRSSTHTLLKAEEKIAPVEAADRLLGHSNTAA